MAPIMRSMTDVQAVSRTAPLFLAALKSIKLQDTERISYGERAGSRLSTAVVMVTWGRDALHECSSRLAPEYGNQCCDDPAHVVLAGGIHFHTPAFNSMGFAKVKYIFNALSLGYDVIFLDADIVMLKDPLPYMYGLGADVAALADHCEVMDDEAPAGAQPNMHIPANNIGALFFRGTLQVSRCVYAWFSSMWDRRKAHGLWDQEEFGKTLVHCTPLLGIQWRVFDNRRFVSACYPKCGCAYEDADRDALRNQSALARAGKDWSLREGLPYISEAQECGPEAWREWTLVHFPCQGSMDDKRTYMRNLLQGVSDGLPKVIKNIDKVA